MGHSGQHYIDAAGALKSGGLGSAFEESGLSESEVSRIHRVANFQDNALLMGMQADGIVGGMMDKGFKLAQTIQTQVDQAKAKSKRHFDTVMFLTMLEDRSRQLGEQIAQAEAGFEAKYGDAWREIMANKVLDPDEIPQRREDESIADYRARLEGVLINKMIDPETGQIKPEYLEGPETAELAKWAKDKFDKRTVDSELEIASEVENDPTLSREEIDARHQTRYESMDSDRLDILRRNDGLDQDAKQIARVEEDNNLDLVITSVDAGATLEGFG